MHQYRNGGNYGRTGLSVSVLFGDRLLPTIYDLKCPVKS